MDQAFAQLQSAGLRPGRISEMQARATAGTVTTQFPAAGGDTQPGAPVDIVVATSIDLLPWILAGSGLLLAVAAGSLLKVRTKAKSKPTTEPELNPSSVSLVPQLDAGAQSISAEDGELAQSEFRLEGRADKGIQTLNVSDRLVTGEA
jgi:hypothetical protein